ncbi:MAG: cytochrome c-type biogenesis protein [Candidatus Nitrospinota bacterium M3_3B_026]
MRRFIFLFVFVSLLAPGAWGAAESPPARIDALYDQLQREMMCLCGCNSTLKNCPHANCDFAIPRRREILAMLKEGKAPERIKDAMVERFGEKILSAPKKEGFNLLGYIMPFVAILAVGSIVTVTVRKWARRGAAGETGAARTGPEEKESSGGGLEDLMRKELEDFDK